MLPQRIKEVRKSLGMNQEQFAELMQVTQGAVSQWETGRAKPSTDQLLAIANASGRSVDDLLGKDRVEETAYRGVPRIKELRKAAGMSQKDFGELFQISQNAVSRWETGEREMSTAVAVAIAKYFNVSLDYLWGNDIQEEREYVSVGQRIDDVLSKRGVSQNRLAQRAGVSQSAISAIIGGEKNPSIVTLKRIAKALNVSVAYLAGEDDEMSPRSEVDALYDTINDLSPEEIQRVQDFIAGMKAVRKNQLLTD